MKYIYQHLGLGDHLICNGLIREIIKKDNNITYCIICMKHNLESIKFMYRDLNNISVIEGDDNYVSINKLENNTIFINTSKINKNFEHSFYSQHNIDYEKKYDSFYVKRDYIREEEFYETFNINEEYIFVHDDNRYFINNNKLPKDIRIIKPIFGLTQNIFDYCKLIQNAKEVHGIDSSFILLNDIMNINNNSYIHKYSKWSGQNLYYLPFYKNTKIIE